MPEMAAVEVLTRRFDDELKGQTITGVKILNPALVKGTAGLDGKLISRVKRRGNAPVCRRNLSSLESFHLWIF